MISKEVVLNNEEGLHARPATEIAKTANQYSCNVKFNVQGKEYNAKSVLNIMSAGIKNNTHGEDEENALTKMLETLKNNSLI